MLYEYTAICLCVVLVMVILILSSLELLWWDCYDYSCTCVLVHIRIHFCWVNGLELLGHRVYITELAKVIVPYCLPTSSAWEFQKLHIPRFHSSPPLVYLPHSSHRGLSKSDHWLHCLSPPVVSHWSQHEMHSVWGLIWSVPATFPTSCPLYSSYALSANLGGLLFASQT